MSEELNRKLYNYEEKPPEKMWSRIAGALDEEADGELTQKLYNIEITPPPDTWNKIVTALETNIQEEYPAKLYNLEITPPAETWQRISTSLDAEESLPQIPSKRRLPLIRYAAAAAFIGAVAFGTVKFLNQKTDHSQATKIVLPQKNSQNNVPSEAQKNTPAQTTPLLSNDLPKENLSFVKTNAVSKKRPPMVQASYMTQLAEVSSSTSNSSSPDFQQASLRGEVPGNCSTISEADRYLNFINPDGYLIRISKKLADALGCFYKNGNSREYNQCQEQIKKWGNKIAQSPASSPDNFLDILDIIKSAQDEL